MRRFSAEPPEQDTSHGPSLPRKPSSSLIWSPKTETVRRLRRLAQRREPGHVLLEGRRVLSEARAAGLEFELIAAREGDKFPFHSESRVPLTPAAFRAATQTVTPQAVIPIALVHAASPPEAIQAARDARWRLIVLYRVKHPP